MPPMQTHYLGSCGAFRPPYPEDKDNLAKLFSCGFNETIRRLNLHPVRAPPKALVRSWISSSNKVDPERVSDVRLDDIRLKRQACLCRRLFNSFQRGTNLLHDDRGFDQRIRGNNVYRLP